MTEQRATLDLTEFEKVSYWHFDYYKDRLGLGDREANELVLLGINPHDWERLRDKGCDPKLARRILQPV